MNRLQDVRCRVLVVDDNKDNADSIAMLLRMDGYEILTAYDGKQALDDFDVFDPQIALLDLALPKVNGYDLALAFKERKPGIRLIAISGLALPADIERSREAGFDHHLVKPFDPKNLERVLKGECREVADNIGCQMLTSSVLAPGDSASTVQGALGARHSLDA
jgi:CheY-like chemotaxis protein